MKLEKNKILNKYKNLLNNYIFLISSQNDIQNDCDDNYKKYKYFEIKKLKEKIDEYETNNLILIEDFLFIKNELSKNIIF
jgi:hypothetical protein